MVSHGSVAGELLRDPRVYALAFADFLLIGSSYVMVFWMPTLIKSWGISDVFEIGLYSAVPAITGVIGMLLMSWSSDRFQERRWHFMAAVLIAAVGLSLTTVTQGQFLPSMAALCLSVFGLVSATPIFMTALSEYLPRKVSATGLALITSVGILGGAAGPAVTGFLNATTGSTIATIYFIVGELILAGLLVLFTLRRPARAVAQLQAQPV